MADERTCPKCGFNGVPVLKNGLNECPGCGIFFEKITPTPSMPGAEKNFDEQPAPVWHYYLTTSVIIAYGAGCYYGHNLTGPEYLLFFAFVLAGSLFFSTLARIYIYEGYFISLIFCLGFEAMGGWRIFTISQRGGDNFGAILAIMVWGGLLFFLRLHHFSRGKESGGGCSSCSGGCNGGCGGCGD